jgi:peptide/nickel transport system ATP-binding protein
MEILLDVDQLKTCIYHQNEEHLVVDQLSFQLKAGEIVALIGESGSGKSITSLSIMGLIPAQIGCVTGGRLIYQGIDLTQLSSLEWRRLRGKDLAMIFQEPMTSLNPVFTIGEQLTEAISCHRPGLSKKDARQEAFQLLEKVELPRSRENMKAYPHQLSGGMLQRVIIAMAMAHKPRLLIADEPTTALDVTVQAHILDLLRRLCLEEQTTLLLITHDLGVVAEMAERVLVLYAGQLVESAPVHALFDSPQHPYTQGLLKSMPSLEKDGPLYTIPGSGPHAGNYPNGCRFVSRCDQVLPQCGITPPPIVTTRRGLSAQATQQVRCYVYDA